MYDHDVPGGGAPVSDGPVPAGPVLDTRVSGDSQSCQWTADWLDTYTNNATYAADYSRDALYADAESWTGPASDRFADELRPPHNACEDLAYTCETYANALRDFAGELDAVNELMQEARDKATQDGLEVDGPFILPPESPGDSPAAMSGTMSGQDASDSYDASRAEIDAFNDAVDEYNQKVDSFNACGEIVAEARKREDEAHAELLRAIVPEDGEISVDDWYSKYGGELVSAQRDIVEANLRMHEDVLTNSSRLARSVPHIERALTITSEIHAAIKGDQSWAQTTVDVAKPIATTKAIQWGLKVPGPPQVKLLTAAGAGIAVELGADKIVGYFSPEDDPYAQPTLDHQRPYVSILSEAPHRIM
ncbi:hypothetical protein [Actinophytocola sp.]|uniref:hypothetical protein n=1 Tax=Actinophytocola sp. TaxID=1872138 RepID=UPI003D6BF629